MTAENPEPTKSVVREPAVSDVALSKPADAETDVGTETGSRTIITEKEHAIPLGESAAINLQAGDRLGKYQIRSRLGAGAMGSVYQAFDTMIERDVAIKVLSREVANSGTILQRFLAEARAIGKLNHQNVVSIYDVDMWQEQYYLVMEMLAGGSLAQLVESRGPLPWQEACQLVAQAAQGLAAAHVAGMVHRDVKPENLMLSKDGTVKVVDFGLSKVVDAAAEARNAMTRAGQILGTPHYMSPEQFEAREVDCRTDIYSLGGTLFRLMTGRFPYQESQSVVQLMTAHVTKSAPVATTFDATIPKPCDRIIARAMAKKVGDRYQSASEMAAELLQLIDEHHPHRPTADAAIDAIEESRELATVTIVEPSKMQAAILADAMRRVGIDGVSVYQSCDAARRAVEQSPPDLLITAMQLPDGRGLDLVSSLSRQATLGRTTVVLNSSDLTIEEFASAGEAAALVLAPRKARPDDLLRAVHAGGPCHVGRSTLCDAVGPTDVRVQVILDSERIPASLAELIRSLDLLDVTIVNGPATGPLAGDVVPTLVLKLRTAGQAAGDMLSYAKIVGTSWPESVVSAAVQVDGDRLFLRAVSRHGVVSVVRRRFDGKRLIFLLQACRR